MDVGQVQIDLLRGKLETVMNQLDPSRTTSEHQQYLAGWIEGLHEMGHIPDPVRDILYEEYVG